MTYPDSSRSATCPVRLDKAFYADPHPTYRMIKEAGNRPTEIILTTGMAYLPPGLRAWLVTAYDDVMFVLRDPRFRKNIQDAMPLFAANTPDGERPAAGRTSLLYDNMANNDPPKHTRLRKPLNAGFSARTLAAKRAEIELTAMQVLDNAADAEEFDLVADYAFPFSIAVICATLGVPAEDRRRFNAWVQTITGDATPEALAASTTAMAGYLRDLINAKRAASDDDILSHLAHTLADDEAVAQAYALLAAGYETTANLISTGFLTLFLNPAQRDLLWSDPSLVPHAVEELLRHQSPFNLSLYRYVTEPATLHGVNLKAGDIVFLSFAAANRDDRRFDDPDTFRIDTTRRDHVAFGGGVHNCIGKHLARLEAEVAFTALIRRCPRLSMRTPVDQLDWKASPTFRGLRSLRVGPGPARNESDAA